MFGSAPHSATTTHLLMALLEPGEDAAWVEFDHRYRPVLIGFLRHIGVRDQDVEDVAQQTLLEFCRAYREGKYNREKGRLGSWLIGIAQRQAASASRQRRRGDERSASIDEWLSDPARLTHLWEQQHERAIYERAWETLRSSCQFEERTLRAFELTALRAAPGTKPKSPASQATPSAKRRCICCTKSLQSSSSRDWMRTGS